MNKHTRWLSLFLLLSALTVAFGLAVGADENDVGTAQPDATDGEAWSYQINPATPPDPDSRPTRAADDGIDWEWQTTVNEPAEEKTSGETTDEIQNETVKNGETPADTGIGNDVGVKATEAENAGGEDGTQNTADDAGCQSVVLPSALLAVLALTVGVCRVSRKRDGAGKN